MNETCMRPPVATSAAPSRAGRLGAFVILILLLALVQVVGLARGHWSVLDGKLLGPDSYMRLVRVERLHQTGDWYDSTIPRSNAPYGEVLHWTRPLDVMLLAGAALLAPVTGFHEGLFIAGVIVGPLLYLLTALALLWGAAVLLSRTELVATAVMFLFQASVSAQFQAGEADHHSLQALLFTGLLAGTLRLLARPRARLALAIGLIAAAAIWVSVEGLLAVALTMAALAGAWLVHGRQFLTVGTAFALAAAGALALVLVVERPPAEWLVDEYDRVSIAHLVALLTHAAVWLAVWAWYRTGGALSSLRGRAVVLLLGAIAAATVSFYLYPKLLAGPFVDISARVREIWLPQISEMMPILGQADLGQFWYLLLLYIGAALPATVYMLWLIRGARGVEWGGWTFLLLVTLVYLGLGVAHLRWGIYAQIAALPAYGKLLQQVLRWLGLDMGAGGRRRRRFGGLLLATGGRLAVLLVFALGFPAAALLAKPSGEAGEGAAMNAGLVRACDVAAIGRLLNRSDGLGRAPRRILTYIFDGPELLYRTPHAVVATPYHRNRAGILDTYDFFAAVDEGAALEIVGRRGIDWVLLCPRGSERLLYRREGETTLLDRLSRGEVPAWLAPVLLPLPVGEEYRLFAVKQ